MAVTAISDLWTPDVWIPGVAEEVVQQPSIINSGVVVRDPRFDAEAAGPGTKASIPFFQEPNYDDQIQAEPDNPTINAITGDVQISPIMNRVSTLGHGALAGAVSGSDPVAYALQVIARQRLRQRQKTLVNVLAGVFGTSGSGALAAHRNDNFVEVVGNQTSAHFLTSTMFNNATALLGENKDKLAMGGGVLVHPDVETNLLNQDDIDYVKDSEGRVILTLYKGIPLYRSSLLRRAGTTSGYVYTSYVFGPRAIAMGDKPQISQAGLPDSVASLVAKIDEHANSWTLYDRTRFVMLPAFCAWGGTPSGQSATNAELATEGNWSLVADDIDNVPIVQIKTNG